MNKTIKLTMLLAVLLVVSNVFGYFNTGSASQSSETQFVPRQVEIDKNPWCKRC